MSKDAVFTVKLETDLRDAFLAEAASTHQPASQLVREFMREFVRSRKVMREHDTWFRAEVRKAIDDPRPGIPHDTLREKTLAAIDRILTGKAKGRKAGA
jgi:hypothetical protein